MYIFSNDFLQVFGQMALAVFLGALIGAERRLAHKMAGMRTFALVCMGASLFVIISEIAFAEFVGKAGFDPSRIASQIVVGIGFLGAGAIIRQDEKVRGLTTAAGLWVTAAIGMAVGYRMFTVAIAATFLTLIIFVCLWIIEKQFAGEGAKSWHGEND